MVRIPQEYQEVEYLESTGTQYIDLQFGFDPTDKIKTRFSITDSIYNDKYIVSPIQWNTNWNRFGMGVYVYYACAYGQQSTALTRFTPTTYNDKKLHYWSYENYVFSIDDVGLSRDVSSISWGNTTPNLRLFYGYNSNTVGQIAYYNHTKQDGIGCNLIPCYRKSDNEPGMYDTVSKTFFTNSGTGTFLVGNDVNYSNTNLLEVRRRILLNTPHLESMSGNPAIFTTDMARDLKECKIHFTPVQAGEGTPSPENVRAISGWDGVSVTRCGKNLWNFGDLSFTRYKQLYFNEFMPKGIYTFSAKVSSTDTDADKCNVWMLYWKNGRAYPTNGAYISRSNSERTSVTFDFSNGSPTVIRLYASTTLGNSSGDNVSFTDIQLELGSEATAYEPYHEDKISLSFPQTIYGGYVDLMKGEIVEEWKRCDLTTWAFTTRTHGDFNVFVHNDVNYKVKSRNEAICSILPMVDNPAYLKVEGGDWLVQNCQFYMSNERGIDTAANFLTFLQELKNNGNIPEIVYALETPQTYSLTPQTIKALKGLNNLYSDANGNVEVKFWKH